LALQSTHLCETPVLGKGRRQAAQQVLSPILQKKKEKKKKEHQKTGKEHGLASINDSMTTTTKARQQKLERNKKKIK